MYSEAEGRLLRHDTSAGVSLKANLEDISTRFLLQHIVVCRSCFFPPEPGNKISLWSVSQRFMSDVSKIPQNKYIKSNSEILSIMVMLMPVLEVHGEKHLRIQ